MSLNTKTAGAKRPSKKPLKVVHFADLHLGMENYGKTDPESGLNQRIIDFLRSLDQLVQYVLKNRVELVVFAGDAYKNKNPNQTLTSKFAEHIRKLTREEVQVFLLVGNHDRPNVEKHAHSMAVFDALEAEGVTVAKDCRTYRIKTRSGELQVSSLPHFSRSYFYSLPHLQQERLDDINLAIAKELAGWVDRLAAEAARQPELPSILVAHVSVADAILGTEQKISVSHELVIQSQVLARPEFDYVALGHLHRHQVISMPGRVSGSRSYRDESGCKHPGEDPPLVYSGSMERVDFSEEREEKGFYHLELSGREACYKFVPLEVRPMLTIETECGDEDPTAKVLQTIAGHDLDGQIVRLRLRLSARTKELLRLEEVKRALEPAYYVSAIETETEVETSRLRQPGLTEEDAPLKALEHYLESRLESKARQKELLSHGKKLIEQLEKEEQLT